jgi:hypothetical protein
MNKLMRLSAIGLLLLIVASRVAVAYPVCVFPSSTILANKVANSDIVALVKPAVASADQQSRNPEVIVRRIASGQKVLTVGQRKKFPGIRKRLSDNLYILFGSKKTDSEEVDWSLTAASEASYNFALKSPSPKVAVEKRLKFYSEHLEDSDEFIAQDAHTVFASVEMADFRKASAQLPKDRLLNWTLSDRPKPIRRRLYGMLLGVCGDEETAESLKAMILKDDTAFRSGIDGVMSGYLMLAGEEGLSLLEERKWKKGIAFSEVYDVYQAVRFVWRHGEDRIPASRLRQSVRRLMGNPMVADLCIADLGRMEDWSALDQIVSLYDRDEFNIPATKRAIVRYLYVCSRLTNAEFKDKNALTDEISNRALQHLSKIRKRDPKLVKLASKYIVLKK